MSFPRYPSYKDSGVEWLGEVPAHWEVNRARNLGVFSGSGIDKKTVEGEQPVKMFNYLDVYNSIDKTLPYSPDLMDTTAPAEKAIEHAVRRGDILLTPSSETSDDVGHAARVLDVPDGVVYSYHILRFRGTDATDPAFLTYSFNAAPTRSYFASVCTGTTRMVLGREDFKSAPVAMPPLPEQTQIAAFLDRETAKIDGLVAEQRRLMELLKEKRQAVISHAVTQGLNPHAPMKPSGIEWLGEVPEHWRVGKCGFYLTILSGFAFPSAGFSDDETDTMLLRGINVGVSRLKWDETVYWRRSPDDGLDIYEMQKGDLVIGMDRPLISEGIRVAKVKESDLPCLLLQRVASLKTGDQLDVDYVLGLLSSEMFVAHFSPDTTGVSVPHISPEQIKNFVIPVPPVVEQVAIVAFVRIETAKSDTLTIEAQRAIALLQERRTALISAAVTGQIDVRGLATPSTT
jgi:type I restriction enzyme, S subunit